MAEERRREIMTQRQKEWMEIGNKGEKGWPRERGRIKGLETKEDERERTDDIKE